MKIHQFVFLISAFSFIGSNVYAKPLSQDACERIAGHWQGIITFKDKKDCNFYDGCTHLVMGNVSNYAGEKYQLYLNPAVGEAGEYFITCAGGGYIKLYPESDQDGGTISCNHSNQCIVKYQNAKFHLEAMKS